MTLTLSVLTVLVAITGIVALIDSVLRLRHRGSNSVLAVLELVLAVAMLLTFFVALPAPLLTIAIALEVVLVLTLVIKGRGGRRAPTLTIVALVANTVVLLASFGWLTIPGFI